MIQPHTVLATKQKSPEIKELWNVEFGLNYDFLINYIL